MPQKTLLGSFGEPNDPRSDVLGCIGWLSSIFAWRFDVAIRTSIIFLLLVIVCGSILRNWSGSNPVALVDVTNHPAVPATPLGLEAFTGPIILGWVVYGTAWKLALSR